MNTFKVTIKASIALVPLAWLAMNGIDKGVALLLGGFYCLLVLLFENRILRLFAHVGCIVCGMIFVACAYFVRPYDVDLYYRYDLIAVVFWYAIPCGICLSEWAKQNQEAVALTVISFAVLMSFVAVLVVTRAGTEQLVQVVAGEYQRRHTEDVVQFLKFFSIRNVIIGVIPLTIFAFATLPIVLVPVRPVMKLLAVSGAMAAAYVNASVLTRTGFASGAIAMLLVGLLIVSRPGRGEQKRLLSGLIGAMLLIPVCYELYRLDFSLALLLERFRQVGEDTRWIIWAEAINLLAVNPLGGGIEKLLSHRWAHNLFLDVGLTSGWLALFSVLTIHIIGLRSWYLYILKQRTDPSSLDIILFGASIAVVAASMIMPLYLVFLSFAVISTVFAGNMVRSRAVVVSPIDQGLYRPSYSSLQHLANRPTANQTTD